jgi:hypothetical protein
LFFFFCPLCCVFFFDLRILNAPVVSSKSIFICDYISTCIIHLKMTIVFWKHWNQFQFFICTAKNGVSQYTHIHLHTTDATSGAGTVYLSGTPAFNTGFSRVRVAKYVVFYVVFCRLLLIFFFLFFWSLFCLSYDLRLMITHLVSQNLSWICPIFGLIIAIIIYYVHHLLSYDSTHPKISNFYNSVGTLFCQKTISRSNIPTIFYCGPSNGTNINLT